MRIWDLPPRILCRQHLLGEHRELHAIWSILTAGKQGYRRHPETIRWQSCLRALFLRHQEQVEEMSRRGYQHHSPLAWRLANGRAKQIKKLDSLREQKKILKKKQCDCRVK